MTKYQIEELEKVDRMLIRHILNAHSKTSIEWLYADTGIFNIKSLIQIQRLTYSKVGRSKVRRSGIFGS